MTTDTLLTMAGIEMGLQETNWYAASLIEKLGVISGLAWHTTILGAFIVTLYAALFHIHRRIAYTTITCHNLFYIYILIHNVTAIWEAT